jgi:hypothetical protein
MNAIPVLGALLALSLGLFLAFWAVAFLVLGRGTDEVLLRWLFGIIMLVGAIVAFAAAGLLWTSRRKLNAPR